MAYSAPSSGLQVTPCSSVNALCSFSARRLSDASSSARSFAYSSYDGSPSCAVHRAHFVVKRGELTEEIHALCTRSSRLCAMELSWKGCRLVLRRQQHRPCFTGFLGQEVGMLLRARWPATLDLGRDKL